MGRLAHCNYADCIFTGTHRHGYQRTAICRQVFSNTINSLGKIIAAAVTDVLGLAEHATGR